MCVESFIHSYYNMMKLDFKNYPAALKIVCIIVLLPILAAPLVLYSTIFFFDNPSNVSEAFAWFGVSRNLVGIIFYTRKVLLTSHYEKRLFEHASQPRVAGSDIRLLSYLWS